VASGWNQERALADGRACLQAALAYLARGWSVVPVCPPDHVGVTRRHRCDSPGKAPLLAWKEYQRRLPVESEVRGWWQRWPNANVGIVLGAVSGLIGVDIDGPAGERELERLSRLQLPPCWEFTTPGGGRRLLYEIPRWMVLQTAFTRLATKEEVRFLVEGTQTVAPPSRHRNGALYEWIHGSA
jgi:Bifunctional DNA primase/polymerase, N-terminal